jgi:ATP-binding cassette, subfamily B, bacterial
MTSVWSALVIGTLMAVGTAALYGFGAHQVLNGSLALGDLLVFTMYLVMLYQPLEQLSYTAWALEGAAAGMQRCYEVLDRENDVPEKPNAHKLPPARGEITFEGVSFQYSGEKPVLQNLNFRIQPGETVGIVGGTGNGKSTLLGLVPRFYDPQSGQILVDGHNLRDVTKKSLRAEISIVLQDTLLFSTTIRENISYGKPGATFPEIEEAARRAQALDFIRQLPLGFESPVGERGSHLTVGQRQRIGIARAFLKNAPILLLDEPTSALDPGTERAIMDALEDLMQGRTTLLVTHRLGTVHHLQRILVLSGGTIAEEGGGRDLVERRGIYANLYEASHRATP